MFGVNFNDLPAAKHVAFFNAKIAAAICLAQQGDCTLVVAIDNSEQSICLRVFAWRGVWRGSYNWFFLQGPAVFWLMKITGVSRCFENRAGLILPMDCAGRQCGLS